MGRLTSKPSSASAAAAGGTNGTSDRDLVDEIEHAIERRREPLVKLRRRLHATPEASGEERSTTALVAECLREIGLSPRVQKDDIGVVVDLDLGAPGGTFVALRSELDCVRVNDDKQVPYASTREGLCHACGHDAHTTINLAVASVLTEIRKTLVRSSFRHNLRLIFQPAEETAVGARSMISQGVLDGVEAIVALHVDPFIEVGRIGVRRGPLTSAFKSFNVAVRGRGGHSARPYEAVDPIPAATNLVGLFYQLAPRSMDSRYPLALTVASIEAGSSINAIPDRAVIGGTLRAARVQDIEAVQKRMEAVAAGIATATGCEIHLEFPHACPATDNDARLVEVFADVAAERFGLEAVEWMEVPSLGGEDFAFYQELIPGAMIRLGTALADSRARRPLHSSRFDIDEAALAVGAKIMTAACLRIAADFDATPA